MKIKNYFFPLMFCAFLGISADGCEEMSSYKTPTPVPFAGEHPLRKMMNYTSTNTSSSGSFFLLCGDLQSKSSTSTLVKFAWRMDGTTYAISSLPMEKIRVRFDEKIEVPTISFGWKPNGMSHSYEKTQYVMDEEIVYAVITVREQDWKADVQLPMGTNSSE